jgi:osmotically-inducible protein OsmY
MKALNVYVSCVFATGAVTWLAVAPVDAEQQAPNIKQAVERSIRGGDFARIEVSVAGSEITLSGAVPHLFAKNEAIERTLQVTGVETVASELQLPIEEEDAEVAKEVVKAISRYAHFTIWDNIDGRINKGVVTLSGSVTPNRDKKRELYDTITKIRGVQDYIDEIEIQSTSISDARLREVIGRNLASSEHFERTVRMRNPPYHIVVNRGTITMRGYVQSEIEYREMELIIRQTQGILTVDNQLQVLR